jgi:hypothetical protein
MKEFSFEFRFFFSPFKLSSKNDSTKRFFSPIIDLPDFFENDKLIFDE